MRLLKTVLIFSGALAVPALAGIGGNVISFRSNETGAVGLMTEAGEIVAPAVFDGAGKASHGICAMRLGNRYGYFGEEGLALTEMNLRTARDFTATPAGTPYASVRRDNGGWNIIDERGIPVFSKDYSAEIRDAKTLGLAAFYLDSRRIVRDDETLEDSFRDYAQKAVNNHLSFWYPKKEYETTQDWRVRVTEEKLLRKIEELRNAAAVRFVTERGDATLAPDDFKIVKYDADNSAYLLKHKKLGGVLVPVPRKESALFRENFDRAEIKAPDYGIGNNDRLTLRSADFIMPDGKVYRADPYAVYEAGTRYAGLEISLPGGAAPLDIPPRAVLSDVDRGIPALKPQPDRARFACILVNETYEKSANVLFAGEDGYAFEKYCEKTLGIARERILRSKNNSLHHMRRAVRELADKAKVYPDAEVIFFYVGKSVSDRYGNEYLLPTDCRPEDGVRDGFKLLDLYEELGSLRAKLVTVFLDSRICLKSTQGGSMTGGGKTLIALSDAVPAGNSVVFRSALAEESPQRFAENSHGLFTYFLLKKIKETRGNVAYAELADYLETQVKRTAVERFAEKQTAHATPSEELGDRWATLKIR